MQAMKSPANIWAQRSCKHDSAGPLLDESSVRPYGHFGIGILTSHPVGLLVVAGVILIVVTGIPAARWFFAGSVAVGALFGLILWLYHRNRGY